MIFDIAVIGAGPAGATLTRLLNPSLKIAVFDKKNGAAAGRQKPCGGLLAPDAQKALAAFGLNLPKEILVNPQIFAVRTIDQKSNLTRHYQRFYINVDRAKFDEWLVSLIPPRVEIFKNSAVKKITRDGDIFCVTYDANGEEKILRAKNIAGADGANSLVRRTFFPNRKIRQYAAVQQWFKETHSNPFYACVFDPEITDCYSWSVSKDGYFIFGGAYPAQNCRARFERQKKKLKAAGFNFGEPVKTEACLVSRPSAWNDFVTGADNVFLLGEAAGFISPSSLEGISGAFNSAARLAAALNSDVKNKNDYYNGLCRGLKFKYYFKLFKTPFLYNPFLRKLVMLSGVKTVGIIK